MPPRTFCCLDAILARGSVTSSPPDDLRPRPTAGSVSPDPLTSQWDREVAPHSTAMAASPEGVPRGGYIVGTMARLRNEFPSNGESLRLHCVTIRALPGDKAVVPADPPHRAVPTNREDRGALAVGREALTRSQSALVATDHDLAAAHRMGFDRPALAVSLDRPRIGGAGTLGHHSVRQPHPAVPGVPGIAVGDCDRAAFLVRCLPRWGRLASGRASAPPTSPDRRPPAGAGAGCRRP